MKERKKPQRNVPVDPVFHSLFFFASGFWAPGLQYSVKPLSQHLSSSELQDWYLAIALFLG